MRTGYSTSFRSASKTTLEDAAKYLEGFNLKGGDDEDSNDTGKDMHTIRLRASALTFVGHRIAEWETQLKKKMIIYTYCFK